MNKTVLKEKIDNAFASFKTAVQVHSDINRKRADGGWSVGEIANHIVKSTDVNLGAVQPTERPYDQYADSIRDLFLNFNLKFPAAPELQPDARHYAKEELFSLLDKNMKAIYTMIDQDELTETCVDIALPFWGNLTKYEWLVLFENHIIRHTKQVNDFDTVKHSSTGNNRRMENFELQKDIQLLCVKAGSFPEGIKAAQEQLLSIIKPDTQRGYFGISYLYDDKILYMAGVAMDYTDGEIPDGCTTYTLKKGNYNSMYIADFAKDVSQVDSAFKKLLAVPGIDESGCCAECYLQEGSDFFTAKDIRCMVRLAD